MDLTITNEFSYSAHSGELQIGGIFIRIYNQQPTYPIKVRFFRLSFLKLVVTISEIFVADLHLTRYIHVEFCLYLFIK